MNDTVSKTRLYAIFSGMKQRCYNPRNQHYKWYGAKGITLCEEWMGENGVSRFMEWALSNGYEEHLSIDRIDSDGPYSPQNCRWVTSAENISRAHTKPVTVTANMSVSEKVRLIMGRKKMTMGELAEATGQTRQNLSNKMTRGNFTEADIEKLANALGCTVEITFRLPNGDKV